MKSSDFGLYRKVTTDLGTTIKEFLGNYFISQQCYKIRDTISRQSLNCPIRIYPVILNRFINIDQISRYHYPKAKAIV